MMSVLLALCAALGMYLIVDSKYPNRSTRADGIHLIAALRRRASSKMLESGLGGVSPTQFLAASAMIGAAAMLPAATVFGLGPSTVIIGLCAACSPAMVWRRRRVNRRRIARESWPRLIEELRVLTASAGRPVPQALLEVGLSGPEELRPAFRAAQREWALTTDFELTLSVLKRELADPTADATFETLLVAAEVGGGLDRRLAALAEDRRIDLMGRKDAQAKQAGARFARLFVILVPAGMALAGLSVGEGADSYRSGSGQLFVSLGVGLVIVCWAWASRIMRLPEESRVFER